MLFVELKAKSRLRMIKSQPRVDVGMPVKISDNVPQGDGIFNKSLASMVVLILSSAHMSEATVAGERAAWQKKYDDRMVASLSVSFVEGAQFIKDAANKHRLAFSGATLGPNEPASQCPGSREDPAVR
ncbi:hypothetical protein VTL71DRAFT_1929 [Oculimacula yallundae]|uniref:Uncharacterized protein n=1 Tax=Oculimacula yallundae TaxID=86028 RepID=A0ABR4CEB9_9HELO